MLLMRTMLVLTAASALIATAAGCGGEPETIPDEPTADQAEPSGAEHGHAHDPDDVPITAEDVERPESYADAVARIKAYRDSIREEISAGRPSKAHRPLDELTFVLEWLPEIALESGVPKEHWETINVTSQQLRDLFDQVHANIDADRDPDFAAVADDVAQRIERLEAIVAGGKGNEAEAGTAGSDGDGESP